MRHISQMLREADARTGLPVTLSDGRPEERDGCCRGEHGIEDARRALFEAGRGGLRGGQRSGTPAVRSVDVHRKLTA